MKKFIRDKTTGAFLTGSGEWTADKAQANDFLDAYIPNDFAEIGLLNAEWYYCFDLAEAAYDCTSPMFAGALKTEYSDA